MQTVNEYKGKHWLNWNAPRFVNFHFFLPWKAFESCLSWLLPWCWTWCFPASVSVHSLCDVVESRSSAVARCVLAAMSVSTQHGHADTLTTDSLTETVSTQTVCSECNWNTDTGKEPCCEDIVNDVRIQWSGREDNNIVVAQTFQKLFFWPYWLKARF